MVKIEDLRRATFLSRPNRFVTHVEYMGKEIKCHLPNPGRMIELLEPGQSTLLIKFTEDKKRKTRASVVAVEMGDEVIQLNSNLVSGLIPEYLANKPTGSLSGWRIARSEVPVKEGDRNRRLDYLLLDSMGTEVYTEVKSTTLVRDGIACFPDAVSARARHHLDTLHSLAKDGKRCLILFVVYRSARAFSPCVDIDPEFSQRFSEIRNSIGVTVLQAHTSLIEDGNPTIDVSISGELPVL